MTENQRPITPVVTPNLGFQYEINHPKSSSSSFSDNSDNKNVEISTIAAHNYNNNDGNVQTFINTDTYQQSNIIKFTKWLNNNKKAKLTSLML